MKIKQLILISLTGVLLGCILTSFTYDDGFKLCNPDKVYATNDYMYKDSYFKDFEKLNNFPKYPGGSDSIQAYFDRSVHFTGDETQLMVRYHIIFIVNCNGEIGKVELKSKEFAGFEKIVNACKQMPKWMPSQKNKQNVDCYFRLGFTNQSGKLKVDYREK